MIPLNYECLHKGVSVGNINIRIVENRDEAVDPDHGWWGNFSIEEQLRDVSMVCEYPALLIRWVEVDSDCRNMGHGRTMLQLAANIAVERECKFLYCAVDTDSDFEVMKANYAFYEKCKWKLVTFRRGIRVSPPFNELAWIMGYKNVGVATQQISGNYEFRNSPIPYWLLEWEPTIVEPD